MSFAMLGGLWSNIKTFFSELLSFIPKLIYLLYASLASIIDILQLFFRKLAGLDVYYVDGNVRTGDLVTNFIGGILGFTSDGFSYSALTTVFWSFVVFGIIMAFVTTFVAIIKSHYSYDEKAAKGPMQYVYTGVKAIINIAVVPIIVFLGLYVSQALLTALDSISSTSSGTVVAAFGETTNSEGKSISVASRDLRSTKTLTGQTTYVYYDMLGYGSSITYSSSTPASVSENTLALCASSNVTFSGSIFKLAAFNGNRVRIGEYDVDGNWTGGHDSNFKLFQNATNEDDMADLIDLAFASNLHLKDSVTLKYGGDATSWIKYITSFRTQKFNSFSKFNIGLVWYYYDLWSFNFIVGFAACIVCTSLFINIIMGLITRIFMCLGLFLVAPPLFGLAPIDGGKAAKNWQENFIKQALMAYGAVVGMNLMLIILPFMNNIDFFNIAIADLFAQSLIIITGLVSIKAFIAMLSGLIGAADANAEGGKVASEVGQVAGKAVGMTLGAGKLVAKGSIAAGKMAYKGVRTGAGLVATGISAAKVASAERSRKKTFKTEKAAVKGRNDLNRAERQNKFLESLSKDKTLTADNITQAEFEKRAKAAGMSTQATADMWKGVQSAAYWQRARGQGSKALDATAIGMAKTDFATRDKNFKTQSDATGGFNAAQVASRRATFAAQRTQAQTDRARFAALKTTRQASLKRHQTSLKRQATDLGSNAVDVLTYGAEFAFNPFQNFMRGVNHEAAKPGESPWKTAKSGFKLGNYDKMDKDGKPLPTAADIGRGKRAAARGTRRSTYKASKPPKPVKPKKTP